MTRRKGERTDKHRDLSHPYQVELAKPSGGAGHAVMSRWAAWFDHETTRNGPDGSCWCFCRPEVADAFAMDFGGRRRDLPIEPRRLAVDLPDRSEIERRAKAAWIGMEIVTGGRLFGMSAPLRGAERMPFSSFSDPADLGRCQAVLDRAWALVESRVMEESRDLERMRLAYIVVSVLPRFSNDDDLIQEVVDRFCS
ncbi:hypothetical protein [Bosea sp. TND4EK4]|uniref:hypothetical protein n=1 Tax=Bosea sp. TND4EK4 TaxID=1907408 RepID=UPI000956AD30|nr:hypothetical protein [Bosea sp. TND4EK4]SIP95061.1 hypothetical protein SAMN05880592_101298 [Bosea sp. TND4EK4]